MRLDKYLKVTRLIKRRTVANDACDAEKIVVNGKVARASYDVKVGDIIEINMGTKPLKVKVLSGGERNRLQLALALKEEGNVLLLDEPTNDIDVNTLRALEEGLDDFAGCAVVISHDRWFLDRICTHILAFEGDSNVFFFEGSYSEYEENKLKRMGKEEPTRVRYRKLTTD